MLIYVPSNGRCSVSKVDMRQPKIGDLRGTVEMSSISEVRKTQFVKTLVTSPDDINEITTSDRDYLFVIAVASLTLNKINFSTECSNKSCKKKVNDFLMLDEVEPVFLKTELKVTKKIGNEEYTFKKLLVKDEIAAVDWANKEDPDFFEQRFDDARVCAILGYEVNDENVEVVNNLDMAVYYAAQFFQICCPHGLDLSKLIKCECGQSTLAVLDITGSMLNINMAMVMDRFASIAGTIDFKSFMDMSLPEYNTLVDSLNAKSRK